VLTSEADFEVCGEAENGREAIEKTLELRPDVIVMDLSMPVMNGVDAARALKELMPTVPLINSSSTVMRSPRTKVGRQESPLWPQSPRIFLC
jgi:chemotaxis response regulator CheB